MAFIQKNKRKKIFSWGQAGTNGFFGYNGNTDRSSPIQIFEGESDWKDVFDNTNDTGYIITDDGKVWGWGENAQGQLCDYTKTNRSSPVQCTMLENKKWRFAAGVNNTGGIFINEDDELWTCGYNSLGRLGDGTVISRSSPVQIAGSWKYAIGSGSFTVGLQTDGTLWSWGQNNEGQLGQNIPITTDRSSPVQVGTEKTWKYVMPGLYHCVAIKRNGTLWAWGKGNLGEVGDNGNVDRSSPVQIGTDTDWIAISTGGYHTVAIKSNKEGYWTWGYGNGGRLGDGTAISRSSPVQVGTTVWKSISCSYASSIGIKSYPIGDEVWTWGKNTWGELGLGDTVARSSPVQVKLYDRLKISSGFNRYPFKSTGYSNSKTTIFCEVIPTYLYAWGDNTPYEQLGDGTKTDRSSAVQVLTEKTWKKIIKNRFNSVLLSDDGELYTQGQPPHPSGDNNEIIHPKQEQSQSTDWRDIASVNNNGFGLKQDNTLWTWGNDSYGVSGLNGPVGRSSPTQISGTWSTITGSFGSVLGIKTDGTLWGWGYNVSGQLGQNDTVTYSSPVQIGSLTDWKHIGLAGATSSTTALAIKTDGTLWAWGGGQEYLQGRNSLTAYSSPVQVGTDTDWKRPLVLGLQSVFFEKTDGSVYAWGGNNRNDLPINGLTSQARTPMLCDLLHADWYQLSAAARTTYMLNSKGDVFVLGEIGIDYSTPQGKAYYYEVGNMIRNSPIIHFPIEYEHQPWLKLKGKWNLLADANPYNLDGFMACKNKSIYKDTKVLPKRELWMWGYNNYSATGDGTITHRSSPVQELTQSDDWDMVARGTRQEHTGAIKSDGSLWMWGRNNSGQLGQNDLNVHRSSPTQIAGNIWQRISCGYRTAAGIDSLAKLYTWGADSTGALGQNTNNVAASSPTQVGTYTGWKEVSVGTYFMAGLKADGTIWTWGGNAYGQLGDNSATTRSSPVQETTITTTWVDLSCGESHMAAIKADGTLWTWGLNNNGELGIENLTKRSSPIQVAGGGSDWADVSCGYAQTLALKLDGSLWTWGDNAYGQQAQNEATTVDKSSPTQIGTDTDWTHVYAARRFCAMTKKDGSVWSCGYNTNGNLGNNDTAHQSSPVQVVGSNKWYSSREYDTKYLGYSISDSIGITETMEKVYSSTISGNKYIDDKAKRRGNIYTAGDAGWGQLGNLTSTPDQSSPVQIISNDGRWVAVQSGGTDWTIALKEDGSLWSWGYDGDGMLGHGVYQHKSSPTQIGTLTDWTDKISCEYRNTMVIKQDGSLWMWGNGAQGQLGDNTSTIKNSPIQSGSRYDWISGSVGKLFSAGITSDGRLWTWGSNGAGQLGNNNAAVTKISSPIQTVAGGTDWKIVACGYSAIAALKTDGTLWSWGQNLFGEIGDNSTVTRSSPVQEASLTNQWEKLYHGNSGRVGWTGIKKDGSLWGCGNAQAIYGSNARQSSPAQFLAGKNIKWQGIARGSGTIIGWDENNFWGWGSNAKGLLGTNSTTNFSSPVQILVDKKPISATSSYELGVFLVEED